MTTKVLGVELICDVCHKEFTYSKSVDIEEAKLEFGFEKIKVEIHFEVDGRRKSHANPITAMGDGCPECLDKLEESPVADEILRAMVERKRLKTL